jgi:hypothetical protein
VGGTDVDGPAEVDGWLLEVLAAELVGVAFDVDEESIEVVLAATVVGVDEGSVELGVCSPELAVVESIRGLVGDGDELVEAEPGELVEASEVVGLPGAASSTADPTDGDGPGPDSDELNGAGPASGLATVAETALPARGVVPGPLRAQ